jgi:hypothetical protein
LKLLVTFLALHLFWVISCGGVASSPGGPESAATTTPIATLGATSPTSQGVYTIVFEVSVPPGTLSGPLAAFQTYRFRLTGFANRPLPLPLHVSPAPPNTPNGEVSSLLREQDVIYVPVSRTTPAGTYELSVQTPDGSSISATFEHAALASAPATSLASAETAPEVEAATASQQQVQPAPQVEDSPATVAPSPPSAEPQGIGFRFGSSVSSSTRATIEDAFAFAREAARSAFQYEVGTVSIFASSDSNEIGTWYAEFLGSPSSTSSEAWQTRTAEAAYRSIFLRPPVGRDFFTTIAHEYFHVVENELMGKALSDQARRTPPPQMRNYGPNWLMEGAADLFGLHATAERNGLTLQALKMSQIQSLRGLTTDLQVLETSQGFQSVSGAYQLSYLASSYLTDASGLSAILAYYRLIGEGWLWQDAFAQAFGRSIDSFYTDFERYQQNGYR